MRRRDLATVNLRWDNREDKIGRREGKGSGWVEKEGMWD